MRDRLPDEVRWELLEANYQSLPPVIVSFPFLGWLLNQALSGCDLEWRKVWLGILAFATLFSLVLCWAFRGAGRSNYALWASLRAVSAGLNGLTFGLAGLWLMVPNDPSLQIYVLVVIMGGAAVSVTSSASFPPSLLLYLSLSLTPVSLHGFDSDGALAQIGSAVPIFMAVLMGVGLRSYRLQRRSALLAHQNVKLVLQLTQAQVELEQANQGLNDKVARRARELSRFRTLLEAGSEGILIACSRDLSIVDWNPPAMRLLELETTELPRLSDIQVLSAVRWSEQAREGCSFRVEATAEQPIEVAGRCQSFDGELYLVLVVRDATERLNLEKQLLSSQKIEMMGQLAGGIAHDFNNMLSVVLGMSEYLRETFAPGDSRRQDVTDILETGERARELTGKLLRLSRSKLDTPELIDLNERIRELNFMLRRSLAGGIELVVLLHESPLTVRVVPVDLDQVLLNLAVNATDAMPDGGTFTIELRERTGPASLPPGTYAYLEVRDTGKGMSPSVLARAFDPFFSTKGQKGHGLGLAVSESVIRRAGGLMTADSKLGEGTTFRIWLPTVQEKRAESQTADADPGKTRVRGARVLLVEDQDALRSLLEKQLARQGFQVTSARSSEEALTLAGAENFHLLLSDIVLPGMSGVDLARHVHDSVPHILLMSGYADQAPVLDGKPLPLLNKPFTGRELSQRLQEILG